MHGVEVDKRGITFHLLNIALILAFILGITGGLLEGDNFWDALYHTLGMYVLHYSGSDPNILLNIARFLAAFFAVGTLARLLSSFLGLARNRAKGLQKDSTFVTGNPVATSYMLNRIKHGIDGNLGFVKAKNYILMNSETENIEYYMEHYEDLENRNVYLRTETIPGLQSGTENMKMFNLEEIAARQFWMEHSPYDKAYVDGKPGKVTVSLIGFGWLGEQVLLYGTQLNSYAEVTYHVFGKAKKFKNLHKNLDKLNIVIHETPWHEHVDILEASDMVLMLDQARQLETISDLMTASAQLKIYAFSPFEGLSRTEDGLIHHRSGDVPAENCVVFNWEQKAATPDKIVDQHQLEEAMNANYYYLSEKRGLPLVEDEKERNELRQQMWQELSVFQRYAYLSINDLRTTIANLRAVWGEEVVDEAEAQRIFHNLWCAYYWFNNWEYAALPNPDKPESSRNNELRLHKSLVPLEQLDDEENTRERRVVRALLSVGEDRATKEVAAEAVAEEVFA